jgi:chaperonin GroES
MKLRPLRDRVLIKRVEEKKTTRGGIIIPDTAKEKPQEGLVIAVGAGRVDKRGEIVPLDVKVGDRILFGKYSGTEVRIEEQDCLIIGADDIFVIMASELPGKGGGNVR